MKLACNPCFMWGNLVILDLLLSEWLFPFNWKKSCFPYAWSISANKEETPFAHNPTLEVRRILIYVFDWLCLVHSYLFLFYLPPSSSLYTVFDAVSSNADNVISFNPYSNEFTFGNLNVHHSIIRSPYTILAKLIKLVNSVKILSQMALLRLPTSLFWSLTLMLWAPVFWIQFYLLTLKSWPKICYPVSFPVLGNSDHVVVSVSNDFPLNRNHECYF